MKEVRSRWQLALPPSLSSFKENQFVRNKEIGTESAGASYGPGAQLN